MVLSFNSQYGHITETGLRDFVKTFELEIAPLREITTVDYAPLEFTPAPIETQGQLDKLNPKKETRCPHCGKTI